MQTKQWLVRVGRDQGFVEVGQVGEKNESLARCAALSRYGVTEEDMAMAKGDSRGAAIYPDEDFEVSPLD